jgi:hypothetical protein
MSAEPRGPCDGEDDGNEPEEACEERARPQTAVEGTGRAVGAGHVREAAQVTGLSGESLITQIESRVGLRTEKWRCHISGSPGRIDGGALTKSHTEWSPLRFHRAGTTGKW